MMIRKMASVLFLIAVSIFASLWMSLIICDICEGSIIENKIIQFYSDINGISTIFRLCIVLFLISIVCHLFSRDGEKVDKGLEVLYDNLSDKRKFIRMLWISLFAILFIAVIFFAIPMIVSYKISLSLLIIAGCTVGVYQTYKTYKRSINKKD